MCLQHRTSASFLKAQYVKKFLQTCPRHYENVCVHRVSSVPWIRRGDCDLASTHALI